MSEQLRRIRDRGRTGKDKRLAYVEYGAKHKACLRADCTHAFGSEGCALDDRDLWWQANCALWAGRITEESLLDQRQSMPPAEFMREFLSWWNDPESVGGALPYSVWLTLKDPGAERGEHPTFGLDVDQDRTAWIAVAWRRADGLAQVSLTNDGQPMPAHRAIEECARLTKEWRGPVAAPKAFEDDLKDAGIKPVAVTSADFTTASGAVYDAITAKMLRHGNQAALNAAVKAASWRNAGTDGSRAFLLKDCPEVGPLAAMTRALHALKPAREFWGAIG